MVKVRYYYGDETGGYLGINSYYQTREEADEAIKRVAAELGWYGIIL